MLDTVPLQSRFLDHADHYARWSGLAIGIVAAQQLVTMKSDDITMPLVFAITTFGLCAVGGVLLGDALTLRPQEAVRTASLAPRLVRDQVPPRMAPLLLLQAASLVTLLVIGAVTASSDPDRMGRAGRVITVTCEGMRTSLGPWPGLYYSGPMFAALAVGTPVCVWALRRIAHGPGDDQQRRDRAWAITGAWGAAGVEPGAARRAYDLRRAHGEGLRRPAGRRHHRGDLPPGPAEPVHLRMVPGHRGGTPGGRRRGSRRWDFRR
ncbi:hypothetical protein OHT93_28995 [Streptomyces sp. NBC_00191]|uniref:hypothetical protein n=1 Tax=Streptomyces sp. NBC_00191 TaxID=2975674 RepID=UPI003251DE59